MVQWLTGKSHEAETIATVFESRRHQEMHCYVHYDWTKLRLVAFVFHVWTKRARGCERPGGIICPPQFPNFSQIGTVCPLKYVSLLSAANPSIGSPKSLAPHIRLTHVYKGT